MTEAALAGKKIVVVGGCGHVGLPLGVKFALAGATVRLVDIDRAAIAQVNSGSFPFLEHGGDAQLAGAIRNGLEATEDPGEVARADAVVFVVGTPVDEHLNPKLSEVVQIFDSYARYFAPRVLVIMRSTLFPGTLEHLRNRLAAHGQDVRLAFCPERVSQGNALDEMDSLPQIVSAFDDDGFAAAYELFSAIAPEVIRLTPIEAEMTKLMANSWRYLEFAIANQFYMMAESKGVDFYKLFRAIRYRYPRAEGYKSPGFAAGPCLFKDTMQLASFFDHHFALGHSAMLVNESLAGFVAQRAAESLGGDLWGRTVGLLGAAFKADNDDIRESLSFKVKKNLEFRGATVLLHDPYLAQGPSLGEVLAGSEALVLCSPHREYLDLEVEKPLVDVWGVFHKPALEVLPGRAKMAGCPAS